MIRIMMLTTFAATTLGIIALGASGQAAKPSEGSTAPSDVAEIKKCLVKYRNEVLVSAEEAGILVQLDRSVEGREVEKGQPLGQIDDVQVQKKLAVAKAEHAVAQAKAESKVDIEFNKAAWGVAKKEYELNVKANVEASRAKPLVEIERLGLAQDKAFFAHKQAELNNRLDGLTAGARLAEVEAATEDMRRRKIVAPLTGEVDEIYPKTGEWLTQGAPIMHVGEMDVLWVKGYLKVAEYDRARLEGKPVKVEVLVGPNRTETFEGTIDLVESAVQDGDFRVRAEVQNRRDKTSGKWLLTTGMQPKMTIFLGGSKLAGTTPPARETAPKDRR